MGQMLVAILAGVYSQEAGAVQPLWSGYGAICNFLVMM